MIPTLTPPSVAEDGWTAGMLAPTPELVDAILTMLDREDLLLVLVYCFWKTEDLLPYLESRAGVYTAWEEEGLLDVDDGCGLPKISVILLRNDSVAIFDLG